jgi:hypothetical protein
MKKKVDKQELTENNARWDIYIYIYIYIYIGTKVILTTTLNTKCNTKTVKLTNQKVE